MTQVPEAYEQLEQAKKHILFMHNYCILGLIRVRAFTKCPSYSYKCLGLSQLCFENRLLCFWAVLKNSTYYAQIKIMLEIWLFY